jgi:hypothetical protein
MRRAVCSTGKVKAYGFASKDRIEGAIMNDDNKVPRDDFGLSEYKSDRVVASNLSGEAINDALRLMKAPRSC